MTKENFITIIGIVILFILTLLLVQKFDTQVAQTTQVREAFDNTPLVQQAPKSYEDLIKNEGSVGEN